MQQHHHLGDLRKILLECRHAVPLCFSRVLPSSQVLQYRHRLSPASRDRGHDSLDSTCADIAVPDYSAGLEKSIEGLRVGIPKEFFSSHLNDGVAATVSAAIKELEAAGAVIVDVSLPSTDLGVSTYYVIAPAEASANLSRYDGVRYGYRCDSPSDLQDLYLRSRTEGFGEEVKRRILIGTFTLSAASYDQYFMKAQQLRRLIAEEYHPSSRTSMSLPGRLHPILPSFSTMTLSR